MIRFTLKTTTTPIDNALDFLDNVNQEIEEIGQAVVQEISPELLDELRDAPPPRVYPGAPKIEWTSDLQRRAFFASDGFDGGIPTKRTGKLIESWEFVWENLSLIVRNTQDWARFVVGSLAKNVPQAARFQQKFHKITGWKLATIPVQEWLGVAQFLFKKEFQARWKGAVTGKFKGRAFTSKRRRK